MMTDSRRPPRFFITHSSKDADFARRLTDDLRAQKLEGFFDIYSIQPGDDIVARINKGLTECDIFVPILSFAALKSPWCEEEINTALMLSKQPRRNGRPRIIPILIEDCAEAMPALLQTRLYIIFTGRYEEALKELLKGFDIKAKPESDSTPKHRRIDAAVPSQAEVGQCIDLLVQVRFPDSPLLGIQDWPTKQKPSSLDQVSEPVTLEFPIDSLTGKRSPARLQFRVVAPNFAIEGTAEQQVDVPPDQDSKCISFLLTPQKAGSCRINVEVYSVDRVYLSTIPVETTVGGTATTPSASVATLVIFVIVHQPREVVRQPRERVIYKLGRFLRDPFWQGISGIIGIIALIVTLAGIVGLDKMSSWLQPRPTSIAISTPSPTQTSTPTPTLPTPTKTLTPTPTPTPYATVKAFSIIKDVQDIDVVRPGETTTVTIGSTLVIRSGVEANTSLIDLLFTWYTCHTGPNIVVWGNGISQIDYQTPNMPTNDCIRLKIEKGGTLLNDAVIYVNVRD